MSTVDVVKIAQAIQQRGLTMPAIFFLESHKPIAGILSEGLSLCSPLLQCIIQSSSLLKAQEILSSPALLEELIMHLEKD